MLNSFPSYKNNQYAKRPFACGIVRKPTANAIWLFVLMERLHLAIPFLVAFQILSKKKRFVV